jgi:hypothetical protein
MRFCSKDEEEDPVKSLEEVKLTGFDDATLLFV